MHSGPAASKLKRILITNSMEPFYLKGEKLYARLMDERYWTHKYHLIDRKDVAVIGGNAIVLTSLYSKFLCLWKRFLLWADFQEDQSMLPGEK
jgi:hypothetical protein